MNIKKDENSNKNDLSDNINLTYKLEIECQDEEQQEKLYNECIERGIICRILTL